MAVSFTKNKELDSELYDWIEEHTLWNVWPVLEDQGLDTLNVIKRLQPMYKL